MNSTVKDLDDLIIDQLERHTYYSYDKSHGVILVEIYADYRDEVDRKTITEWCQADDPHKAFGDSLFEWYETSTWETEDEIVKAIRNNWTSKRFPFDENEEYITEWLREHIEYVYPEKHFLSQSVCVDIIVDTGDANYDYVLNDVYPHYDGRYEETIPEEASILWLARQQGYNKRQLTAAMKKEKFADSKLLKSLRSEVLNCGSHMNALTFFVEMKLGTLFDLLERIREDSKNDDKDGYRTVQKRHGRGKIILSKDSVCGLYDNWSGSGSVLEIELERDVELPIRFIGTALPDGGRGYGAANVYGICNSFWKPSLLKIA